MVEFRVLPLQADELRKQVVADERSNAHNADWCVAQLKESDYLEWRWLAPRLRAAFAVYPAVADRVKSMIAAPATIFGMAVPLSQPQRLLRLRAGLALLWLGVDDGLEVVLQAIERNDPVLRSAALDGILVYRADLRWPDRYYEALFTSCQRIYASTSGEQRWPVVNALFAWPAPALAAAMREYVATSQDFMRPRAAMWLLEHGYRDDVQDYIDSIVHGAFPAEPEARAAWHSSAKDLMAQLGTYFTGACTPAEQARRAWAAATVLALLERLVSVARTEGEPAIEDSDYQVSAALHAIEAYIGPESFALLARWAASYRPGLKRERALAKYARHAGAESVDVLLQEWQVADLSHQGFIARQLMACAPVARYAELVPVLRALFDAIAPQEEESYGQSDEQEALAGVASALAQFDPGARAYVEVRLKELGPLQVREVEWALEGRTTARIAALLAVGGAIAPMSPRELQSCYSDGRMVRNLLTRQKRLALLNTRDDDIDSPVVQTVKKLAKILSPQLEFEVAVEDAAGAIRFLHAGAVYRIGDGSEEDYIGAAAAFNDFLAHIAHPQRIFLIGNDGGDTDNDAAAFLCGDPVRLPAAAEQLRFPVSVPS